MTVISYKPDPSGLRELAVSPGLQDAVLNAAQAGAAYCATQDPAGQYVAEAEPVRAGYRDELRAGAMVTDNGPNSMARELQNGTLRRAVGVIEAV